ncbi:helix-turn-helix transcriptional regulator [Amycolatopsis rhizosphaerae]|uniref:Helix-turn-helix transcriptional regulator n=1 Tax=Amycolatopsis rhizosphaerae TaxID=2053003 RepID=A0A558A7C1_9PSEU|nr:PadR family transcriptional regulator [Amycolatopsis rhizosphaerae]TVT20155.1 helix-turn-helix transcriptional regulator [Amycolatopsis rhizosphaerae]
MPARPQPLTPLGMAILELLHEKPIHPYEMTQLMRQRQVDRRVKLRPGSLYHTVDRLQAQGFIEIVDTQRQGRRPERTVYAMTEAGRDAFVDQTREMLAFPAPEYPQYPVALSAASELDRQDAIDQLKMRVIALRARIAADEVVAKEVRDRELPVMYWIDHLYDHHQRRSQLAWTEQLVADLESGRIPWPDAKKPPPHPQLSIVDNEDTDDDKAS